jgi:hypothetical protein
MAAMGLAASPDNRAEGAALLQVTSPTAMRDRTPCRSGLMAAMGFCGFAIPARALLRIAEKRPELLLKTVAE